MRTLTWLLLALNAIAAAVWLAGFELPPPAPAASPVPSGAKSLQLLSELPQLPPRLDALPGQSEPAVSAGEAAVPEPVEPAVPAVPADVGAPPVAITSPAELQPAAAAPEAHAAVADAPAPAPACYRTAPLGVDAYERAGDTLRAAGLGEPRLQLPARVRERYWVYWSGSAEQVSVVEAKLKAAGLRDWYRQRGAAGEARLSLGVYGQLDSARRRQRELAAHGIQAQISPHYPPQARLRWVITAVPAAVEAARPQLQARGVSLEPCP